MDATTMTEDVKARARYAIEHGSSDQLHLDLLTALEAAETAAMVARVNRDRLIDEQTTEWAVQRDDARFPTGPTYPTERQAKQALGGNHRWGVPSRVVRRQVTQWCPLTESVGDSATQG